MRGSSPFIEEEKSFSHTFPVDNRAIARSTSNIRENNAGPNKVLTSSANRGLREMAIKSSLDASIHRLQGIAQPNIAPNPVDVSIIENA